MDKESQARRPSLFEKMGLRKSPKQGSDLNAASGKSDDVSIDVASIDSGSTLGKAKVKPKKEKKERFSDSGPFTIEVDENGVAHCRENNRWPPGVHYEVPNRLNKNQGLSEFYTNKNIVPGGEG